MKKQVDNSNSFQNFDLGGRLRHARRLLGLSLRQVAEKADVTEGYVSKLENNKVQPALSTLHRLAGALQSNIGEFVTGNASFSGDVTIISKDARPELIANDVGVDANICLQKLTPTGKDRLLQVNIHVIQPGAKEREIQHTGQEFGFVLEGNLNLKVRDTEYRLVKGDSFSFDSNLPHGYVNDSDRVCRVLWVNTPPTY